MDVLRTQAGGSVRGVNTGVVSGTPGGAGVSFGGSSAQALEGLQAALVVRVRALQAWCNPLWAQAQRSIPTIR